MPLIHEFEKHSQPGLPIINKKRYGNGFADLLPLITKAAKTIGSVNKSIARMLM